VTTDDPTPAPSKIQPFPNEASRAAVRDLLHHFPRAQERTPVPAPSMGVKLGLYPMAEDVIMSIPLYQLILSVLDSGTRDDQQKIAAMMRQAYDAPFP
jgi:hypothetical protein